MIRQSILIILFLVFKISFSQLTFEKQVIDSINSSSFCCSDFDNDGDLDIGYTCTNGTIEIYENTNGYGNFVKKQTISLNKIPTKMSSNDLNFDNYNDLLVATTTGIVYFENNNGFFNTYQIIVDSVNAIDIISPDIDSDGENDIVAIELTENDYRNLNWYKKTNGVINFEFSQYIYDYVIKIIAAKLDNNESIDIIYNGNSNSTQFWSKNTDGLGNFALNYISSPYQSKDFDVKDMDGDGDTDILIGDFLTENQVCIANNTDGEGDFDFYSFINVDLNNNNYINSIIGSDINNDDYNDVICGSSNELYCYINLGSANFSDQILIDSNVAITEIDDFDINNDGKKDIIYRNYNTVGWYENMSTSDIKVNKLSEFIIYPNPVNNILYIDNQNKIKNIEVLNLLGELVITKKECNNIDVRSLNTGIYICKIEHLDGSFSFEKFKKN